MKSVQPTPSAVALGLVMSPVGYWWMAEQADSGGAMGKASGYYLPTGEGQCHFIETMLAEQQTSGDQRPDGTKILSTILFKPSHMLTLYRIDRFIKISEFTFSICISHLLQCS